MNKIFLGLFLLFSLLFINPSYGQDINKLQPGQQINLFAGCLILDDLHKLVETLSLKNEKMLRDLLNDQENTCGIVDPRISFEAVKKIETYKTKDGSAYIVWQFKAPDGKPIFAANRDDKQSGEKL